MYRLYKFTLATVCLVALISSVTCDGEDAKLDDLLGNMVKKVKSALTADELQTISALSTAIGSTNNDASGVTKGLISYLEGASGPLDRYKDPETVLEFNELCESKIVKPCGHLSEAMVSVSDEIYALADQGYNVFEESVVKGEAGELMKQVSICNRIVDSEDVCFEAQKSYGTGDAPKAAKQGGLFRKLFPKKH